MEGSVKIIKAEEFLKKNKNEMQNQEEIWDNISDLWFEYRKEPFDAVKNFLKEKKGLVIDIGCGSGRNMVASKNFEYYGIDFSSRQIECAKKTAKEKKINAKFFKMNAFDLDKKIFKDEMFDYGLFIASLHCIDNKEKRLNALKEFYRVLKFDAEGLISVWNSADFRFNRIGNHGDIYMSWKKDGKEYFRYYYLYNKEELIELLKSVGFRILEIYDSETDRFSKKNLIVRVGK